MNFITVLLLSFTLSGQTRSVDLLSTSLESCISNINAAEAIVRSMGATDVSASCITRFE